MSIFLFGGEMGTVTPSDANVIEATNDLGGSGASYNSAFARCHIRCSGSTSYAQTPVLSNKADIWIHVEIDQTTAITSSTLRTVMEMVNAAGTSKFRLQAARTDDNWSLDYHNGTTWVNLGSFIADGSALQTCDIHIVSNTASGSVAMYMSGTNRFTSATTDFSSIAGVAQLKMYGVTAAVDGQHAFSQIILADEPTVGMRVFTVPVSGVGADTGFTGAYTEIDEVTYSDADFINSGTANQVSTYATTAPALTGYNVRAVSVTARAKRGAGGPQNIQLALRSGGTTYFSSSQALDVAYGAHINVWETNPATSAAWVNTAVASLQPGVKSIA